MFQTLETTWDRSGPRRWSTLASFTIQAMALSLLLAVPLLWVQGPPRLRWIASSIVPPRPAPFTPAPPNAQRQMHASEISGVYVLMPPAIPIGIAPINDADAPSAPGIGEIGIRRGIGFVGRGVPGSLDNPMAIAPPPPAAPTRPLRVSHWAEGNLVYRLQPTYPALARQARIQGVVQMRAVISKTGVIENLEVLSGPAMLVKAAVEAVRQWRYRPYLLNGEPIEVETEITMNFVLGGN